MNVKFEAKFAKDLRTVQDKKLLNQIKNIIEDCQSANSLSDIKTDKENARLRYVLSYSFR